MSRCSPGLQSTERIASATACLSPAKGARCSRAKQFAYGDGFSFHSGIVAPRWPTGYDQGGIAELRHLGRTRARKCLDDIQSWQAERIPRSRKHDHQGPPQRVLLSVGPERVREINGSQFDCWIRSPELRKDQDWRTPGRGGGDRSRRSFSGCDERTVSMAANTRKRGIWVIDSRSSETRSSATSRKIFGSRWIAGSRTEISI